MMSIERKTILIWGTISSILIFILISLVSYQSTDKLLDSQVYERKKLQILYQFEELISLIKDAETGQRGFIITGDWSYLNPYYDGITAVHRTLTELRQLTDDQPDQLFKIDQLENLIEKKFENLHESLTIRKTQGLDKTIAAFNTGIGKTLMGDIRFLVDEIKRETDFQLNLQHRISTQRARNTFITILIGNLVAFLLILISIIQLRYEFNERNRARQALLQSEEKYRQLFDMESDVLLLTETRTGKIIDVNDAATIVYGYTRQELLDMKNTDLSAEPEKTRNAVALAASAIPLRFHKNKAGKIFPVEITASHFTWQNREVRISAIRDITFRIEAEKKRIQLESQLNHTHKMEAIGTLAGGIAHEFNNILSIMVGNAELASDDVPEWNPARKNIIEIIKAGQRAKDVVSQLLRFSRKSEEKRYPIDIVPLIKETLKLLRSSIPANIEFRQKIPETCHTIFADPTQIHQVILNLVTNAAHAVEYEGGIIEISINNIDFDVHPINDPPDLKGRYVHVSVSDTGNGIEKEVLDRIFEPFFTTKEVGKGTGMGLAVVHGIIESHHAHITVKSEITLGTRFDLYFPAIDARPVTEDMTIDNQTFGNEKILLVDDEEPIVILSRNLLERQGYQVSGYTNSLQAFEVFSSNPEQFDLVITDMAMPKLTGDTLIRKIKAIRPSIKTIICTGYSDKIDEMKASQLGIDGFVLKPINRDDLALKVRSILDG